MPRKPYSADINEDLHSDLVLPPAVLEAALSHVLRVGGELSAYRFRSFAY